MNSNEGFHGLNLDEPVSVPSNQSQPNEQQHSNGHHNGSNDLSRISRNDQSPACMSERDIEELELNDLNSSVASSSNENATDSNNTNEARSVDAGRRTPSPPGAVVSFKEHHDIIGNQMSPIPISAGPPFLLMIIIFEIILSFF